MASERALNVESAREPALSQFLQLPSESEKLILDPTRCRASSP